MNQDLHLVPVNMDDETEEPSPPAVDRDASDFVKKNFKAPE